MDKLALRQLSYGLYLVTTAFEGQKAGYVANTVFQVTSAPPMIAISCHKDNYTLEPLLKSGVFAVSVLSKACPAGLIGTFGYMSGKETDKFSGIKTSIKSTGVPVVTDSCTAWFECRVEKTLDLGTHLLITGLVVDSGMLSGEEPLTYDLYRNTYKLSSPRNAPTYLENDKPGSAETTTAKEVERVGAKPDPEDNEPYICMICGHVYRPEEGDPSEGIPPGTPFSDLPEEYRCPICNAGKDYFKPLQ